VAVIFGEITSRRKVERWHEPLAFCLFLFMYAALLVLYLAGEVPWSLWP